MVLTIDIGNTNIVLGSFQGGKLTHTSRLFTDAARTADQYAIELRNIFSLSDLQKSEVEGCIISSVVPRLSTTMKHAVERYVGCEVLTVSAGIKTGLNIKAENPAGVGADFVCAAVAAGERYPLPCVVADLGTATKLFALDETGAFIGGVILPGVMISLEALAARTAQLPAIGLEGERPSIITTNTTESMRAGLLYGTASMLDGLFTRFAEALNQPASYVATGGIAHLVVGYCKETVHLDDNLVLDGLYRIFTRNRTVKH